MAAIGAFGKLKDTVVPLKGTPFNLRWLAAAVPANVLTPVFSQLNAGLTTMWVSKIYASAPVRLDLELHVDLAVLWSGGTTVVNLHPPPWDFTDAEIPVAPGQLLRFYARHSYAGLIDITGNLGGFLR